MKFILATLFISQVTYAASSASLSLSGTVLPSIRIGFNSSGTNVTSSYTFAADELLSFTNVNIGSLYDSSNNRSSNYKITVTSTNSGALIHSVVPTVKINYSITIQGTTITNNNLNSPAEYTVNTSSYTSRVTHNRAVTVSGGDTDAISGSYSDTLTFEVTSL